MYHFKSKNSNNKSGVAKHLIENKHIIDISNIQLVQGVRNNNKIDIIESTHIRQNRQTNLMNEDTGNVQSTLINIF